MLGLFKKKGNPVAKETSNDVSSEKTDVEALQEKLDQYERAFGMLKDLSPELRAGNMEARITGWQNFDDEISDVFCSINYMLDVTDAYIREAGASLDAAGKGQYHRKFLQRGMNGSFNIGAKTINAACLRMEQLEVKSQRERETLAKEFREKVMQTVSSLLTSAQNLNKAGDELTGIATETQELSASVAAASEQASVNVQTVASASEEYNATVQEIARQVNVSSEQSGKASKQALSAKDSIDELKDTSTNIDDVVKLIRDIAEQTNLLALNATIEAARAGEAGKGFAVVASEVKSLANQSADATNSISGQIENIQGNVGTTVQVVETVVGIIDELEEIATSIASSTEEQIESTIEISKSIQEASLGTQEVSKHIGTVNATARQTLERATELNETSETITKLVHELESQAETFTRTLLGKAS